MALYKCRILVLLLIACVVSDSVLGIVYLIMHLQEMFAVPLTFSKFRSGKIRHATFTYAGFATTSPGLP